MKVEFVQVKGKQPGTTDSVLATVEMKESLLKLAQRGDDNKIFLAEKWKKILAEVDDGKILIEVPVEILAGMVQYILKAKAVAESWSDVLDYEEAKMKKNSRRVT